MIYKPVNNVYVTDISGNNIIVISGIGLKTVMTDESGNSITAISGLGLKTITTTDQVTSVFLQCSSGSGGVALSANASSYPFGIIVKNVGNVMGVSGVVRLGSSGNPPFISGGYGLATGESITLNASRADFLRVYGTLSGVGVSWIGLSA